MPDTPNGLGVQITPDPIIGRRLPDYSWVRNFMRDTRGRITQIAEEAVYRASPNARLTQIGVEVLTTGVSSSRVTQIALEVVVPAAPVGEQFTETPPQKWRLPDYSWWPPNVQASIANLNLQPMGEQHWANPQPKWRLPDYSWIGPYFMRDPRLRITQEGIEVVVTATPAARVTQAGFEVVYRILPPGKQRTELGQHPNPKRTFDYSFVLPMPYVCALAPVVVTGASVSLATTQFIQAFAALTANTALPNQPARNAALQALTALNTSGVISATAFNAAVAAMTTDGIQTQNVVAAVIAALTATDDIAARATASVDSELVAIPMGLAPIGSTAVMSVFGAQAPFPAGVAVYELPPTKPKSYLDYSWVMGSNPNLIPPPVGTGQTFQVILVL